jgi:hypothetical protein
VLKISGNIHKVTVLKGRSGGDESDGVLHIHVSEGMLGSERAGMVTMKSKGQVGTSGHLQSGQGYQCCVYEIERKVL